MSFGNYQQAPQAYICMLFEAKTKGVLAHFVFGTMLTFALSKNQSK